MRIIGIEIPDTERLEVALTRVYGVGQKNVTRLFKSTKLNPNKRVKDLKKEEVALIIKALDDFEIEGDLRKKIGDDISRLKAIRAYRGLRHIVGLPARGQRTRSNARTKRGSRKTVGAMTKEMWAKIETQQKEVLEKTNKA